MIITPATSFGKGHDTYSPGVPIKPGNQPDADEMVRASRVKIDRSLETLRRVARLLAELSKKR